MTGKYSHANTQEDLDDHHSTFYFTSLLHPNSMN